jgi:hypothetical protein
MESSQVILLYYLTSFHNCDKIIRKLVYGVTRIGRIAVFFIPEIFLYHIFMILVTVDGVWISNWIN